MHLMHDICALLRSGESVAVATVALQSGSTPRESGAKLAMRENGTILGTVGGGLLEARCMELCRQLLCQRNAGEADAATCTFDLTNEEAAKAAMVCGGRLTVVMERFVPGSPGAAALNAVQASLDAGRTCRLTTQYSHLHSGSGIAGSPSSSEGFREQCRLLRVADHVVDAAEPGPQQRDLAADLACSETGCTFVEGFSPQPHLYIFGAGHVAKPTAHMAASVGFAVTVLDDRAEFASQERFPEAKVRVLADFAGAFAGLSVTESDFLVIMTRGHMHDRTVLEQALATPARYVGMIGSRRKRDALYEVLRKAGTPDADIARCHCPIGLAIGAQTPEEIAVSIVAELVLCRAGNA